MNNKMMRILSVLCVLGLATGAYADMTLGFDNISNNNVGDAAIGEAQLWVTVQGYTMGSDNGVLFTFGNTGPEASSIADVYFDDGTLLALSALFDSDDNSGDAGVDFSPLASPGNLPSASSASPEFVSTVGFSADSDPPVQPNGVNPGETLGIFFTLQSGQTWQDTDAALLSGALRIGIRVQGFDGDGSESFVNTPPIPAPGAFLLGVMGLGLVGWVRKRAA